MNLIRLLFGDVIPLVFALFVLIFCICGGMTVINIYLIKYLLNGCA